MRHPRPTTRARKRNTAAHTCAVQTMNYHSAGGPRSPESVPRRWHCGPSLWNMERPSLPSLGLPGAAAAPPRAQPPRAADYCAAHGPWRAAQNTHFLVLCVGVTELCFLAFRGFSVAFPWGFFPWLPSLKLVFLPPTPTKVCFPRARPLRNLDLLSPLRAFRSAGTRLMPWTYSYRVDPTTWTII